MRGRKAAAEAGLLPPSLFLPTEEFLGHGDNWAWDHHPSCNLSPVQKSQALQPPSECSNLQVNYVDKGTQLNYSITALYGII